MAKKKTYKTKEKATEAKEPQPVYNNRITITTLEALEEMDREYTRNLTHDQRMEYLQKLIHITHSADELKNLEKKFYTGKIKTRKPE